MDISKLTPEMLQRMPAMKPPPGRFTDFADPAHDGSNAHQTVIVIGFLTALTVSVLLLRLYSKLVLIKAHGWDDYLAVGATIGAIAYGSLAIYVFEHGFGVHQWNVRAATLIELTDYLNAILYIYKPFMLMAKLSLCVFFFNIFKSTPKFRWAIYFAVFYNVTLQVTAFFSSIFLCIPGRPQFWQCSHRVSVLNIVTSGFNIFSDFYLLFLPLFALSQLQMRPARKLAILLVFAVGLLACIASILGLIYRLRQDASADVSWNFAPEIILVTFELEATIMVGCFLVMPALFRSKHRLSLSSLWSNRSFLLRSSQNSTTAFSRVNKKTSAEGMNMEKIAPKVSGLSNQSGDSLMPEGSRRSPNF
ncbi:6ea7edb6-16e3-442d-98bf-676604e58bd0 [Sclerotinia trifoliorum]|uniref:6ea7edb6-16e3-442d-98bf-676604e58bd0 n=1 Tax=Sclerotinia trifoliorum TaxID=28548 RepID=A0A8H2VWM0_9HELO|nr:6ea7edb6-16e3-442d-98bf-676604e58bd0 [Sclerotinia trifoliorum]